MKKNIKKKKGFTLIELIIVLAVMAIIALIAIPNFTSVRNNSKNKADKQSCEVISRAVLMLVADDTVNVNEAVTVHFKVTDNSTPGAVVEKAVDDGAGDDKVVGTGSKGLDADEIKEINTALKEVKKPQGKTSANADATQYAITIGADGSVDTVTE